MSLSTWKLFKKRIEACKKGGRNIPGTWKILGWVNPPTYRCFISVNIIDQNHLTDNLFNTIFIDIKLSEYIMYQLCLLESVLEL